MQFLQIFRPDKMQLFWLFLVDEFTFQDPMVPEDTIWWTMGVHENVTVFAMAEKTFCLFFSLGSEVVGEDAYYLLLLSYKLHDILIDTVLHLDMLIFLQFLIGHLQYFLLLAHIVAHAPMEIPADLNVPFLQLDLPQ